MEEKKEVGYYGYIDDWVKECLEISEVVYKSVKEAPDKMFGVGKDWVAGYKRDIADTMTEKAISPYNYYRDRRIEKDKKDGVVFFPADEKYGVGNHAKHLCWGPEGTATEVGDNFELKYTDGRTGIVPKTALKEKTNAGGFFWTFRAENDVPTNIFPRNDDTKLYNIHEFKPR